MAEPRWSEDGLRTVLAHAVRGSLLSKFPGCLTEELFGIASPRGRIAAVLGAYWEKWRARPTLAQINDEIDALATRLSPAERKALQAEWKAVLQTELAENPESVYERVREWLEYRKIEQGLQRAASLLGKGPETLDSAREILTESIQRVEADAERQRIFGYMASLDQRVGLWAAGDAYGERIPTGLPALDAALDGGPTRRECYYFLAPPKGAKTASLLRVALGALRQRFGVYVVTYEMQAIRMMLRLDRTLTNQTKQELQESTERLKRIISGLRASTIETTQLSGGAADIWVEEHSPQQKNSVDDVKRRIDDIRRSGGRVDVVVLDYLNIMGSSKNEREKRHELAAISRDMGALAKEMDVLVWSAALVKREAVNKPVIRKTDIAEAFEVIAICDGMIAICASPAMIERGWRRYFVAAAREEADERLAGDYAVDFKRMTIKPIDSTEVDAVLEMEKETKGKSQ